MVNIVNIMELSVEQESLYNTIIQAFETLGGKQASLSEERFLRLVRAYQHENSRYYHDLQHINELIAAGIDPAWRDSLSKIYPDTPDQAIHRSQAMLSFVALYHDLIEVHIDGSINDADIEAYEKGNIVEVKNPIPDQLDLGFGNISARKNDKGSMEMFASIQKPQDISDIDYELVLSIFGLKDGQELIAAPTGALNELYSAFLFTHDLSHIAPDMDMATKASIIGAIELSFPFRNHQFSPNNPVTELKGRLEKTTKSCDFKMDSKAIDQAMLLAVGFANRDISSFRQPEFGAFIDETMRLAPELTPSVRQTGMARDYPKSIAGFIKLFENLLRDNHRTCLYRQYESNGIQYPPHDIKQQWDARVDKNIDRGTLYLKTKFVSATLIAAIAAKIGEPNVNLIEFVDGTKALLDDTYFQTTETPKNTTVSNTLKGSGRKSIRGFDIAESPTGAVMFEALKQDEHTIEALFEEATKVDYDNPEHFIQHIRKQIGEPIFQRIAGHLEASADTLSKRVYAEISSQTLKAVSFHLPEIPALGTHELKDARPEHDSKWFERASHFATRAGSLKAISYGGSYKVGVSSVALQGTIDSKNVEAAPLKRP